MKRTGMPITSLAAMLVLRERESVNEFTNSVDLDVAPLRKLRSMGFVEEFTEDDKPTGKKPNGVPSISRPKPVRVRLTAKGREALIEAQTEKVKPSAAAEQRLRYKAKSEDVDDLVESMQQEVAILKARHQRVLRAYLALRSVKTLRDDEAHTPALAHLVVVEQDLRPNDLKVQS